MRFRPTALDGVVVVEPDVHRDPRGFFLETWRADRWAEENQVMTIEENELFKLDTLRLIWSHCFQGERPFPEEKAARLLTMNIQRHEPEKVFSIENGTRFSKEVI